MCVCVVCVKEGSQGIMTEGRTEVREEWWIRDCLGTSGTGKGEEGEKRA